MRKSRNLTHNIDWVLVGIYFLLVLAGWLNIFAVNYDEETFQSIFSLDTNYGKQLFWIFPSVIAGLVVLSFDSRTLENSAIPVYIFTMLLLTGVLFFGTEIKGAKSWYTFGGVSLQPSEFAKIGVALLVAKLLSSFTVRTGQLSGTIQALAIIAVPALLILLQPDTGSTLVFAAFIFVLYREGLSGNFLLLGLMMIVLFVLSLLFELDNLVFALSILTAFLYSLLYGNWKYLLGFTIVIAIAYFSFEYLTYSAHYLAAGLAVLAISLALYNRFTKENRRDDLSKNFLLIGFAISIGFVFTVGYIFTNVLMEHQRTRITVLLGEEDKLAEQIVSLKEELSNMDNEHSEYAGVKSNLKEKKASLEKLRMGAGWNVRQSKIAIGSGGLLGKGFLQGTQTKFNFVPEQNTDFIFCTVGEEWGFVGVTYVIVLFGALLLRLIFVAERQRSSFARIFGYSVASILFIHFTINIAMTIGLAPVIGIPLPFFSKGGSSLLAFTVLLAVFIRLDSDRMNVLR